MRVYFTIIILHSKLKFYNKCFCTYLIYLQYECLTNKLITKISENILYDIKLTRVNMLI